MQPARSDFWGLLVKRGNEQFQYELSDEYSQAESGFAGDYEFFGYLTTTGAWILQRHQISNGQWRYVAGQSNYASFLPFASNLTALGALAWVRYDSIFS